MDSRTCLRTVLLVAVGATLLFAGTGVAAACDTCVVPDDEDDEEYEPLWSNEDVPYDIDENTSLVELFYEETKAEMAEDFGSENESNESLVESSAMNASVDASVSVDAA